MKRYLILGAGVAGRRAAEAIREKDAEGEITLVDEQQEVLFARPRLGELFGRGADGVATPPRDREWFSKVGVNFRAGVSVKELRPREQKVLLGTKEVLSYDKFLIASGMRVQRLPCDDGSIKGVVYMDRPEDVHAVADDLRYVRRAVVYGTSYPAMGALNGLRKMGLNCTLVLPEDRFWPGVVDSAASDILEAFLRNEGVEVVKNGTIQMLEKDEGRLRSIVLNGAQRITTELLVVTTPLEPVLDCLAQGSLKVDSGIVVNGALNASEESIFAAGDVARLSTEHPANTAFQAGWLRAWKQGRIAGANMAGGHDSYNGIPSVRTRVLNLDLVSLGLGGMEGGDIEGNSGGYPYDEMPYLYKKIVSKGGKAAGALFIGDVNEAAIVEEWIRQGKRTEDYDRKVLDSMFQTHYQAVAAHGVLCPVCKFHMQVDDNAGEGSIITCPACGIDFRVERMPNGAFHAMPVN